MTLEDLKKIESFPSDPGVYLMKDALGSILYVGKAKNLKRRIKNYFAGNDGRSMIPYLLSKLAAIETIVVASEKEALLLENNLIKRHQPHYNALLKDDKSYIAIKVSLKEKWPATRLVRYRGTPEKEGLYFGPYPSAYAARQTLDLIHKIFPLRTCSDQEFARRTRPCLLYQMKRCIAPCVNLCTKTEYDLLVQKTVQFLKGQDVEILHELREEMEKHAENLEFERAGQLLKVIQQIEKTVEEQHVDRPLGCHGDVLGLYREEGDAVLVQLLFRNGKLLGSSRFDFQRILDEDEEILSSFLMQHYEAGIEIPGEIFLPTGLKDKLALEEILSLRAGKKVLLSVPQRGEKKNLIQMAESNARAFFEMEKDKLEMREKTLLEMEELLSLSRYPARIECFDNSNLSGSDPVAVMVAFTEGQKETKRYRTYRLHGTNGSDDYASLREVLIRRYKYAQTENNLPDLVLIDGGKGHLKIATAVFEELNVIGVEIVAIAKEEGRHDKGTTSEQLYLKDKKEPFILSKHSPLLFFLQNVRDEAHRFALAYQKKRRSKKLVTSLLEEIPGIGKAKRKALLIQFGSLKKIEAASDEALLSVKGISRKNLAALRNFFQTREGF